ncbi:P-loop containing nucleoside triphosphate hydrolase protein [Dissophora ornata]|nr:P-loop containing nucleoside triphosphate hydrolase protein [Dissophora ornata]
MSEKPGSSVPDPDKQQQPATTDPELVEKAGDSEDDEHMYTLFKKGPVSPENFAWIPSRLTLWWLNGFFKKGYKKRIEEDDLYEMLDYNKSGVLAHALMEKWEAEKTRATSKGKTPSLLRAVIRTFWRRYYTCIIGMEAGDACQISNPLVLQQVINFVDNSHTANPPAAWHGYGLAVSMVCLTLCQNMFYQRWNLGSVTMGIYLRAALIDLVFRKATKLSSRAHLTYPDGAIVNLMSTDASRIDTAMLSMLLVVSVPIYTIIIVGLLIHLMGPSALVGAAILVLANPTQAWAMSTLAPIRKRCSQFTDNRIRLTQEILQGIKVIKFFSWEPQFLQKLTEIRNNELQNVARLLYVRGAVAATSASLPVLASALSFILYGAIGNELQADIVFPALAYFTVLRTPLMVLPSAYTVTVDAYVALKRIQTFLLSEETDPIPPPDLSHEYALSFNDASFIWDQLPPSGSTDTLIPSNSNINTGGGPGSVKSDETATVMSEQENSNNKNADLGPTYLKKLNLKVPRGALIAVVGPVGSGKSSLLQAIVGNMTHTEGQVIRGTNISYSSQTAWIQNATIQDNILFDTPFDPERYSRVIKACSLEADLKLFPFGDKTEIGERGVNLSGGQKARLSLARSVYFDAGMVIMDDPLSAVDAHVGKRIWEDCVMAELKGRTRIIATHQLHVLPDTDYVICMKDGKIAEEGPFKELMAKNGDFCALMAQYGGIQAEDEIEEVNFDDIQPETPGLTIPSTSFSEKESTLASPTKEKHDIYQKESDGETRKSVEAKVEIPQKLMSQEERESGAVKKDVYGGYLKASGGHFWAITFGLFFLQQAANVMGNQWMSWWSEDKFQLVTRDYIGVYAGFALSQLVLVFMASLMLSFTIVRTANAMHDAAFRKVLYSPLAFFDTTPLGRILNRFSRDVDTLDNVLWSTLYEFTITVVTLIGTLILIIVVFPWLVLAILPILGLYYWLSIYYRTTSREVKRLDSNMRSHLYAYFSECLTGLGTLKAFNVVPKSILKNEYRIDLNNRPYYMYQLGARWLSLRVNVLGALMSFSTVVLITATRFSINPASAGLVLSYLSRISGDLNWGVQRLSTLENNMNSAERLVHYVDNLDQERPPERPENKPPTSWPSEGKISFKNVSMRYRPELPRVLRDISFNVQAGHKVGVVGRTGAGKSSLIHALFLLSELDGGEILIDGINTTTLGTADLRPKIAIIPQDPVLFQGTLRYNLDPLSRHTEQELWQVLETSDLKSYVQQQEGGLDSMISAQGENLSVGQRQLVCLSRALLAKSKVVVLDEATASVDMATDALIQKAIRIDFAHSTVVTVAHRINTIIDYDRILVMHQGQVAEYDTPRNLLSNPDSVFSSMVAETGAQNASHLRSLAGL